MRSPCQLNIQRGDAISLMVSVAGKHHVYLLKTQFRVQELCESRDGRPGLPVPNSPYGLCGRKATLNFKTRVVLNTRKMCKCFRFLASCLASISVYAAEVVWFLASNLSSSERSRISSLFSNGNNNNCDVYCPCPSVKSKQKQTKPEPGYKHSAV